MAVSLLVIRLLEHLMIDVGTLALLATLGTVFGCLVLWRVAMQTPARFMYVRPHWLQLR